MVSQEEAFSHVSVRSKAGCEISCMESKWLKPGCNYKRTETSFVPSRVPTLAYGNPKCTRFICYFFSWWVDGGVCVGRVNRRVQARQQPAVGACMTKTRLDQTRLLLSAKIVTNPRSACHKWAVTQTWSRAAHALRANVRRQRRLRQGEGRCWLFYCHSVSEMPHMLKLLQSWDYVMILKSKGQ